MNKLFIAAVALVLLVSGCVRSETSLQKPVEPTGPTQQQVRQIVGALPTIGGNVTVHAEPTIIPPVDDPFPGIV